MHKADSLEFLLRGAINLPSLNVGRRQQRQFDQSDRVVIPVSAHTPFQVTYDMIDFGREDNLAVSRVTIELSVVLTGITKVVLQSRYLCVSASCPESCHVSHTDDDLHFTHRLCLCTFGLLVSAEVNLVRKLLFCDCAQHQHDMRQLPSVPFRGPDDAVYLVF